MSAGRFRSEPIAPVRWRGRALALVVSAMAAASCAGERPAWARQSADDPTRLAQAERAFESGRYEEAIRIYRDLANAPTATVASRRGLVRTLAEVGRYAEAESLGTRFAAASPAGALGAVLGEVLQRRGKLAEAERAYRSASGAGDSLVAKVNLAVLLFERGDRDAAMPIFDSFIDVYNQRRGTLTSDELTAVGTACRYLGRDEPDLFKDALKAYDEAIAADTSNPEPRIRLGELFLEKYNGGEAQKTLDELLRRNGSHPRALLAAAKRVYFDGGPGTTDLLKRALDANPNLAPARAFQAMLHLDREDHAEAAAEAERALAIDSTSSEALAALAAARYLRGDRAAYEATKRRALALNPRDAEFFATLAHVSARNRLYREAAAFAREGTALDAKSWRAWGLLGMNELRIGEIEPGRTHLEQAFKGDPYDVWIKNTLDLLDTFGSYRETSTPRFRFFMENAESELLSLYAGELAEEAFDSLVARYGYTPPTPVRLEVYRSHADFSVRTVGLAGLGALGVSFGGVLAMDSPAARDVGDFNWGSTFWHELAHTFTLGMTDHRVPRWLSEGLSVFEERRARPGWGQDVSPAFLSAYKAGKLVPVSRMNDGFMRPAYPEQIIFSYYQASLVCELVARDFGVKALGDMLRGYKDGLTTQQVFERALRTTPQAFDAKFDAYLRKRFAGPLAVIRPGTVEQAATRGRAVGPADAGEYSTKLGRAIGLYNAGKRDEAAPLFEQAKALFPEYADANSPHWYLSQIHKAKGDARRAAAELVALTAIDENHLAGNVELAALLDQLGDKAGAAAALERAMYISPFDAGQHVRLATLYAELGDPRRAVRERRAVVALGPVDRAEALYQLALAYQQAGDAGAARREVLRALEEAPNFEKAQQLLLTLRSGSSGSGGERR